MNLVEVIREMKRTGMHCVRTAHKGPHDDQHRFKLDYEGSIIVAPGWWHGPWRYEDTTAEDWELIEPKPEHAGFCAEWCMHIKCDMNRAALAKARKGTEWE